MRLTLIVAYAANRVIGSGNTIPWRVSEDLKFFKSMTEDCTVIMGRKTHESIGKRLPNRRNVIMTRDRKYKVENCVVVNNIVQALECVASHAFIIGGAEIYRMFLPLASTVIATQFPFTVEGDATFPELDSDWYVQHRQTLHNREADYLYHRVTYQRVL